MNFPLGRAAACLSFLAAVVFSGNLAAQPLDAERSAILKLINDYRAQSGVSPLRISASLVNAAQWMSNDLASKNYFGHTDSLGRDPFARMAAFGYSYSPAAENIGAGYSDAQNTFNQWITACDPDSSGNCTYAHRQNLLNTAFQVIGIGRATSPTSTYRWYWTVDLGSVVDKTDGRGDRPPAAPAGGAAGSSTITYHNGPVMLGTTHIYYIWYGNWSVDPNANAILTNFANNIGGSPYFNINTTYYDGTNTKVSNSVTFAGSASDSGSLGTSLSDANIWTIVSNAIASGLPVDPNGVYFVLTAPGVAETSGFISSYCGWHDFSNYQSTPIKYGFVGDAAGSKISSCAQQTTSSPNNDPGVDGMVSVVAHELEESVTDPQLNAWYDSQGNENADKCAWTFGTTYTVGNGSTANMRLGSMDYLIQQDWINVGAGSCGLTYGPDFSLSISPASQSVLQGGTTSNYTVTINRLCAYSGAPALSVITSWLPAGVTASTVSSSGIFTLSAGPSTPAGTYKFTVVGTDGGLSHFVTGTVVVTNNSVAAPQFSPAGGSYTSSQSVKITTGTAGASIRYTTDGTNPSETAGTLYSAAVTVASTSTLKAMAYKTGAVDSSITSTSYTITPAYTLTPSPSNVSAGGNLSVSWTAPAGSSATDWIGLFVVGSANTAYGWWQYTSGAVSGTVSLTAPTQAGQYEFRYLLQNGYTDVARSSAITVTPPGPVISSVQAKNIQSTSVTITWNTDVPSDSQVDYGTTTTYTNSSTLDSTLVTAHSVNLTTGLSASTPYHFRVKSKNSSGTLSVSGDYNFTTAGTTGSAYTLSANPASVGPGGALSVSWTAPSGSSATDWIGLFVVGAPNTAYGWWQYTNGATSGTFNLTAPTQTGQYEFRYLLQNGYTDAVRSSAITVSSGGAVISAVLANNTLSSATTITWSTDIPADSQVEYGTTTTYNLASTLNTALVTAHSVPLAGLQTGTTYHFHVKSKNSAGMLSVSPDFTFTTATGAGNGYTLVPSPSSVAAGGSISVSWTAPSGSSATDWVGLFVTGTPNTAYGWWQYTNGAASGTFNLTVPTQTGQYEFRYLLQNGYTDVVRSSAVTVH